MCSLGVDEANNFFLRQLLKYLFIMGPLKAEGFTQPKPNQTPVLAYIPLKGAQIPAFFKYPFISGPVKG